MKKALVPCIAICSWFAVIVQFDLMLANRTGTVPETIIRFFSFFTILTNTIVAFYFSWLSYNQFRKKATALNSFGTLTAITVYITIVGLVYQVLLRHTWNPTGTQKVVDEMLHTVNPVLVIIYWFIHRKKDALRYSRIKRWLVYPLIYLAYVLVRGYFSDFFPYPFLDITRIGFPRVILNSIGMTFLFIIISMLFIWVAGSTTRQRRR